MATTVQSNYRQVLQDAAIQGELMAMNKHTIFTKEEFARLSLNTALPVDILEDKYRAYRNAYVLTANKHGWEA